MGFTWGGRINHFARNVHLLYVAEMAKKIRLLLFFYTIEEAKICKYTVSDTHFPHFTSGLPSAERAIAVRYLQGFCTNVQISTMLEKILDVF